MSKQTKYTKSARGQECTIRIPNVCNFNPETTVLAHLNGGGMGAKHVDIHGAYACSSCHDVVDGRVNHSYGTGVNDDVLDKVLAHIDHLEGVIRTQEIMISNGILKL